MADDEFTPRELGLLAGHAWAVVAANAEVGEVVWTGVLPEVVLNKVLDAGVKERLEEFDDPLAAEREFWPGFFHGARASIVEDLARVAKLD